jgi:hypothetical protein
VSARRPTRAAAAAALLAAIGAALAAPALALELRAELDRESVPVGGQLVMRLVVSGGSQGLPRPRVPAIDDFDVYSAGSSQSVSIVNGRVEASLTESYILVPKREGAFTLGPFEISDGGRVVRSAPVGVRVTRADAPAAPPTPRGAAPSRREAGARNYFVRCSTDKGEAYVNEQVTLTFRFYTRVRLSRDPEYSAPEATGFWVEDLPPVRRYYEAIDGVNYLVNEVKSALFPTSAGTLTIGPATLKVARVLGRDPASLDPFQMFGGDPFALLRESEPEILRTDPIRVRVRPLPKEGASPEFSGLVGAYAVSARLDKETVEAGQPVTLTLVVSGDGNLATAPEPKVALPASVRSYDSGSRLNTSKENYRLRGEKVIEKVLIPQVAGEIEIPPATLVTFDPSSGRFETVASGALVLRVTPGAAAAAAGGGARDVRKVGRDLHPIREGPALLAREGPWLYTSPFFWAAQGIPLVLLVGALRAARTRRALGANVELARARGARGVARRRLRDARRALVDPGDAFFTHLGRSLADYAADTLALSRHGISRDELTAAIAARGLPEALTAEVTALLDRCDMGRFAPGGGGAGERDELLRRGESVILEMERLLRG